MSNKKHVKLIGKRLFVMMLIVATFMTSLPFDSWAAVAYAAETDEQSEENEQLVDETPQIWDGVTTTKPKMAADGYYEIENGEQLAWFADYVNYTYNAVKARLVKDIYLNDKSIWSKNSSTYVYSYSGNPNSWTSIGTSENRFKGDFDGAGHTIYGLFSKNTADNSCGLFAYIDGGKVRDVNLSQGKFDTKANSIGTVASYAENAIISGCTSDVSIYSSNSNSYISGDNRGGIVGNAVSSDITNCRYQGYIDGKYDIGGIAARTSKKTDISGCKMSGYMKCKRGGFITGGQTADSADDVISECTVDVASSYINSYGMIGGITSYLYGSVYDCYINIAYINSTSYEYCNLLARGIYNQAKVRRVMDVSINNTKCNEWFYSYNDSNSKKADADIRECYSTNTNIKNIVSVDADKLKDIYKISTDSLKDGIFTYQLQKATGSDNIVWCQTLGDGGNATPVLWKAGTGAKEVVKTDLIWKSKDSVVTSLYNNKGDNVTLTEQSYRGLVTISYWIDEKNEPVSSFVAGEKSAYYVDETKLSLSEGMDINFKGDGTREKPYIITTGKQLNLVAEQVNSGNEGFSSAYYELGADIVLDSTYVPIGNSSTINFKGHFDGKGHKISGLAINKTIGADDKAYFGLFGYARGAVIKNFSIEGNITVEKNVSGSKLTSQYFGGVVGYADYNTIISDIIADVDIKFGEVQYEHDKRMGGIAGYLNNESCISGCVNKGTINSYGNSGYSVDSGGAIAGTVNANSVVTGCIARGGDMGSPLVYQLGSSDTMKGYLYNSVNESTDADASGNGLYKHTTIYGLAENCYVSNVYGGGVAAESFASGEIAGRLNADWVSSKAGNEELYFCQRLSGNKDAYPLLPCECRDREDDCRVYYVRFICNNHVKNTYYTNIGGTVTAPELSAVENYISSKWICGNREAAPNSLITVNADEIYKQELIPADVNKPEGDGTTESPYLITNSKELRWIGLTIAIENDESVKCASACYKLVNDITLAKSDDKNNIVPIGTKNIPFTGKFNGNGHKISGIYYKETLAANGDEGAAALFAYIDSGAYIEKLTVEGDIYSNGKYAAGLVSHSSTSKTEAFTIEKCYSKVNLTSTASSQSNSCFAGILGKHNAIVEDDVYIKNCFYDGRINATGFAGILGESDYYWVRINNCLSLATSSTPDSDNNYPINKESVYARNNYYLNSYRSSELSPSYDDNKITNEDVTSGKLAYMLQSNQSTLVWGQNLNSSMGTIDTKPVLIFDDSENASKRVKCITVDRVVSKKYYYANPDQTMTIRLDAPDTMSGIEFTEWQAGDNVYTAGTSAIDISYTTGNDKADERIYLKGDLTLTKKNGEYLINSVDDISTLAGLINNSSSREYTKGKKYVLTTDITYNTSQAASFIPIGKDEDNAADNIVFDGNNHVISITYPVNDYKYIGLFGCIKNSTIRNLVVSAGPVSTSNTFTKVGVIAGKTDNTNIYDCMVNADITVNNWYCSVGAIAGSSSNNGEYNNIYVSGKIVAESGSNINETYAGGIIGDNTTTKLTNITSTVALTRNDCPKTYIGTVVGKHNTRYSYNYNNIVVLKDDSVNAGIAQYGNTSSSYARETTKSAYESGSECYRISALFDNKLRIGQKLTATKSPYPVAGDNNTVYKLTYVLGDDNDTVYVNSGSTSLNSSPSVGSNYTFAGWYDNSSFSGSELSTVDITADKVVYGKLTRSGSNWKNINYLNGIVVDSSGNKVTDGIPEGLASGQQISSLSGSQFYSGMAASLVNRPEHVDGYVFLGWYTDADCTQEAGSISESTTEDVTVYAKWKVYTDWNGSSVIEPKKDSEGIYEIYLPDELNWFRSQVNDSKDNTISARLKRDINLSPKATWSKNETKKIYTYSGTKNNWTPIGNSSVPFKGKFYGAGYKIRGMYVSNNSDNAGLFGYIDGATIHNVNIDEGSVVISSRSNVGAIAGYANRSKITDCSSGVSVCSSGNVDAYSGGSYYGGIVGDIDNSTITGCSVDAYVSCKDYIGGIVGRCGGVCKVENCYADIYMYANYNCGGIVGYTESDNDIITISKCKVSGYFTCSNNYAYTGGITSYLKGGSSIDQCEVSLDNLSAGNSGAFVYRLHGTLTNSYAKVNNAGNNNVCGLAYEAKNSATVANCLTSGEFTNCKYYIYNCENDAVIKNSYYTMLLDNPYNSKTLNSSSSVSYVEDVSDGLTAYRLQNGVESNELIWGQDMSGQEKSEPGLVCHHNGLGKVGVVSVKDVSNNNNEAALLAGNVGNSVTLNKIDKTNGMYVYDTFYSDSNAANKITSITITEGMQTIYTKLSASSLVKDSGQYDNVIAGNGSEESPYQISNEKEFRYLRHMMDADANYMSAYYILTADIDLGASEEANFTPIGSETRRFIGSFDGNGHSISNINIKRSSDYVGLFGYTGSGFTIKDITLHGNIEVTGTSTQYVGSIAGYSIGRQNIRNCHSDMTIKTEGGSSVGGLLGYYKKEQDSDALYINNCSFSGAFIVTANTSVNYYGGIIGCSICNAFGDDCNIFNSYSDFTCSGINGYALNAIMNDAGRFIYDNCYTTADSTWQIYNGQQRIEKESVAGGALAYKLMRGSKGYASEWSQNMDSDNRPVTVKNAGSAYKVYRSEFCMGEVVFSTSYNNIGKTYTVSQYPDEQLNGVLIPSAWADSKTDELVHAGETKTISEDVKYQLIYTCAPGYQVCSGEGTSERPYEIDNTDKLRWAIKYSNMFPEFASAYYILTADINIGNSDNISSWGTEENPFAGNINGYGHKISGIDIDSGNALFGYVTTDAVIKNLNAEGSIRSDSQYLSGLVGYVKDISSGKNRLLIDNCMIDVDIISTQTDRSVTVYIGGLVAYAENNYAKITVKNSAYVGEISSESKSISQVGALLGKCTGISYQSAENCFTDATFGDNITGESVCATTAITVKNLFSTKTHGTGTRNPVTVISEDISKGELAYKMNEAVGSKVWVQKLGQDRYPVYAADYDGDGTKDVTGGTVNKITYNVMGKKVCKTEYVNDSVVLMSAEEVSQVMLGGYIPVGLKKDMSSELILPYGDVLSVEEDTVIYIVGKEDGEGWHKINYYIEGDKVDFLEPVMYNESIEIDLPEPSMRNKLFIGWFTSSDYRTEPMYTTKGCTTDLDLYAGFVDMATGIESKFTAAGSGTEADPYIIKNANQLLKLADLVKNNASNEAGTPYASAYYRQSGDIYFNSLKNWTKDYIYGTWIPDDESITYSNISQIGQSSDRPFRGNYDGAGYSICGLYHKEDKKAGIFGYTNGAVIKNVTVGPGYVYYPQSSTGGYGYGLIVDNAVSTTIKDCVNKATINSGKGSIGGIVGKATDNCIIEGCVNNGNIYVNKIYNNTAESDTIYSTAGGIAGVITSTTVKRCTNNADIYCEKNAGLVCFAGVEENDTSVVSECINYGSLYSQDEQSIISNKNSAFVYYNYGTVIDCVNVQDDTNMLIYNNKGKLYNCYTQGNTTIDKLTESGNCKNVVYDKRISPSGIKTKAGDQDVYGVVPAVGKGTYLLNNNRVTLDENDNEVHYYQSITGDTIHSRPMLACEIEESQDKKEVICIKYDSGYSALAYDYWNKGVSYTVPNYSDSMLFTITAWKNVADETDVVHSGDTFVAQESKSYKAELAVNSALTEPVGMGSESNPYQIKTENELRWIAAAIALENDKSADYAAAHYELLNDIELSELAEGKSNMANIGTKNVPFVGEFKGNGHKISGLQLCESLSVEGDEGCAALFGYIGGNAYIHDMEIEGMISTNGLYAAGVVSHIDESATNKLRIERVLSAVNIQGTYSGDIDTIDAYYGGIVATAAGNFTVESCEYAGKISGNNKVYLNKIAGIIADYSNNSYNYQKINCNLVVGTYENISGGDYVSPNYRGNKNIALDNNAKMSSGNDEQRISDNDLISGKAAHYLNSINTASTGNVWGQNLNPEKGAVDTRPVLLYETYDEFDKNQIKVMKVSVIDSESKEYRSYYVNKGMSIVGELPQVSEVTGVKFENWSIGDSTYNIGEETFEYSMDTLEDKQCELIYSLNLPQNENGQYEIDSAEDLELLAELSANDLYYDLANSKSYVLTADIAYDRTQSDNITPIGNDTHGLYRVTFDGNGHKITGINLSGIRTIAKVGLFGYIRYSTVKNLMVEGYINDNFQRYISHDGYFVGLLAGYSEQTSYDNCIVVSDVRVAHGAGKLSIGSAFGCLKDSDNISKLYVTGNINTEKSYDNSSNHLIGGIAGIIKGNNNVKLDAVSSVIIRDNYANSIGLVAGDAETISDKSELSILKDDTCNSGINMFAYGEQAVVANEDRLADYADGELTYRFNRLFGSNVLGQQLSGTPDVRPVLQNETNRVYRLNMIKNNAVMESRYCNSGDYQLPDNYGMDDGYSFVGWSTDNTADGIVTSIDIDADREVYLIQNKNDDDENWRSVSCVNGKVVSIEDGEEIDYESDVLTIGAVVAGYDNLEYYEGTGKELTKPGYVKNYQFVGWYSDEACSEDCRIDCISADSTGDITIYAKWKYYPHWDGSGISEPVRDESGVYLIYYADELAWIAKKVNEVEGVSNLSVKLMDDIYINDVSEWGECDIDNGGYSISDELAANMNTWTPIGGNGDNNRRFGGEFDGNGKTIAGLYFKENISYCGLFGVIERANIHDLNIEYSYIYNNGNRNIGNICGYAINSNVKGCNVEGIITGSKNINSYGNIYNAGGVIGYATQTTIENCVFNGCINGGDMIGGIVGLTTMKSLVDTCQTNGLLVSESRAYHSGGISGYTSETDIINCENNMVTNNCGGLIGYSSSVNITNCVNSYASSYRGIVMTAKNTQIKNCVWNSSKANASVGDIVDNVSFTNVYCGITNATMPDGVVKLPLDDGRVTHMLQRSAGTTDKQVFVQNINGDKDECPRLKVFHKDSKPVYCIRLLIDGTVIDSIYGNENDVLTLPKYSSDVLDIKGWKKIGENEVFGSDYVTVGTKDVDFELVYETEEAIETCTGTGTINDPYLINNEGNLRWAAVMMSMLDGMNTAYYSLEDDIILSDLSAGESMNFISFGTPKKPFDGTFDGNGHSITNIQVYEQLSTTDAENNAAALFGYVGTDAKIRDIYTDGSIVTNGKYASGLIAHTVTTVAGATLLVNGCISDVNINGSYNGETTGYHGGLIANHQGDGTADIDECAYRGRVAYSDDANLEFGGVIGYLGSERRTLIDYSYCQAEYNSAVTGDNVIACKSKNQRVECEQVYYLNRLTSANYGNELTIDRFTGGNIAYTYQSNNSSTRWSQKIGVDKAPKLVYDGLSTSDKLHKISFLDGNDSSVADYYGNEGTKINIVAPNYPDNVTGALTINGWNYNNNVYKNGTDIEVACKDSDIDIPLKVILNMNIDSQGRYQIASLKDWNNLAAIVNNPNTNKYTQDEKYILTGDIVLDSSKVNNIEIMGNSDSAQFSGELNGGGHSIKGINFVSNDNRVGLFGTIYHGTISNLTVSGTIRVEANKGIYAGGIAAYMGKKGAGNSLLSNCTSDVDIIINAEDKVTGRSYVGGLTGYGNNVNFLDCIYSGVIDFDEVEFDNLAAGGIIGEQCIEDSMLVKINNCMVQGLIHDAVGDNVSVGTFASKIDTWFISNFRFNDNVLVTSEGYNDELPVIAYNREEKYTVAEVAKADISSGKYAYDMNQVLITAGNSPLWTIKEDTHTDYKDCRLSRHMVKDETVPLVHSVTYKDTEGNDITGSIIAKGDIGYLHSGNGNTVAKAPLGTKWIYEDGADYSIADVITGDITLKANRETLQAEEDRIITVAQGLDYSIDMADFLKNEDVFGGINSSELVSGNLPEGLSINSNTNMIEGLVSDNAVDCNAVIRISTVEGTGIDVELSFMVKLKRPGVNISGIPEAGSKSLEYGKEFTLSVVDEFGNSFDESLMVNYKIVEGEKYAKLDSQTAGKVIITGVGEVIIEATVAGDDEYAPTPVRASFTTMRADIPELNIISNADKNEEGNYIAKYGQLGIRIYEDETKTIYGEGELSVDVDSSEAEFNNLSGVITFLKAGKISLTVTKEESDNYNKKSVQISFDIAKVKQNPMSIFGNVTTKDENNNYLIKYGQNVQLSVTGGSGNGSVMYYVTNEKGEATDVASVDENGLVTVNKPGIFKAYAIKSTDDCYEEARSSETLTYIVGRTDETGAQMVIPEGMTANKGAYQTSQGEEFVLSVKGLLGTGAITYSSSDTSKAVVDSSTGKVTVVGVGDFEITATKEECERYNRKDITTRFRSLLPNQNDLLVNLVYGENEAQSLNGVLTLPNNIESAKLVVTGGSGDGLISYVISSGDNEAVIAEDGTITGLKTGSYEVTVTKEGLSVYEDKVQKVRIRVKAQEQEALTLIPDESKITVDDNGVWHVSYSDKSFVMTAVGGSGSGEIRYMTDNSDVLQVNISTGAVTIVKPGICTIYAFKEGVTGVYEPQYTDMITIEVDKYIQNDIIISNLQKNADGKYIIEYGSTDSLTVSNVMDNASVSFSSSDSQVVNITSEGRITSTTEGDCKLSVTLAETDYYDEATFNYDVVVRRAKVSAPIISKQPQSAEYSTLDKVMPLSVTASSIDEGTLTYQWYVSENEGETGTAIEGATQDSYSPDITVSGIRYYYCVVTNTKEEVLSSIKSLAVTSEVAKITVKKKYEEGEVGKIIVNEASIWDRLLNTITYGQYVLAEAGVEIVTNIDEIKVEYIVVTDGNTVVMTEEELDAVTTWQEYEGKFKLESEKNVVYAKLTDNIAGYVYYLCTDGITVETTPTPEPTATAEPTASSPVTPTEIPTVTAEPTEKPTVTAEPTAGPTSPVAPTEKPAVTAEPTAGPTSPVAPTEKPAVTAEPTAGPTSPVAPTEKPTVTAEPTATATAAPTSKPTAGTTVSPTVTTAPIAKPGAEGNEPAPTITKDPATAKESKPGRVKVKELKRGKKKFAIKWEKLKKVTGYKIKYSLKKNFKGSKTIVVKGNKERCVIKKLKTKLYYVKMCAYNSAGTGKWSKVYKVRVK